MFELPKLPYAYDALEPAAHGQGQAWRHPQRVLEGTRANGGR
jgi:superoxide dismutase